MLIYRFFSILNTTPRRSGLSGSGSGSGSDRRDQLIGDAILPPGQRAGVGGPASRGRGEGGWGGDGAKAGWAVSGGVAFVGGCVRVGGCVGVGVSIYVCRHVYVRIMSPPNF